MISLNLSVHDVVDTILRTGHLDNRIFNRSSMEEGTRLHSLYQEKQGADYESEYPVSLKYECHDFRLLISGKADGVIFDSQGNLTVEEIKTTVGDLQDFIHDHGQWHLGQAIFYAYMISKDKSLPSAEIVMTYIHQNNYLNQRHITSHYSFAELSSFVEDVLMRFVLFLEKLQRYKKERDDSMDLLVFPFSSYRPGQERMMNFIDEAAEKKKRVFVEAPTGIGKTVSVLYPLCKRFGEKKAEHIFYLTNKNSIKSIAMNTLEKFDALGVKLKSIEFTARDNICFNDKKGHCNPVECPFAKDYYTKKNDALFDALARYVVFHKKNIESLCFEKTMCPFQFQWDLGAHCDVVVCDYNYVFDINDQLELFESHLSQTKSYLAIDECHNLPQRVRDMYSITLLTEDILKMTSACVGVEFAALKSDIQRLGRVFRSISLNEVSNEIVSGKRAMLSMVPEKIETTIHDILTDFKSLLKKHPHLLDEKLIEFFYTLNEVADLIALSNESEYSECFLIYFILDDNDSIYGLRIADLDSKPMIESGMSFFESTVCFSATLTPKDYYLDLLGGKDTDPSNLLVLNSPFPIENRKVLINTKLSLLYKDRNETLYDVYCQIKIATSMRKGNYFVFCPSYEYMNALSQFFTQDPIKDTDIYFQGQYMTETRREEFLSHFKEEGEKSAIGVLVLGGIFSEGIDLVGDRLIGCIIISVGIPQISFERDQLKSYYDKGATEEEKQKGFNYAYTYPGINRVLQAGGRVIRTDTDKGFILFIDSRFRYSIYRKAIHETYPDAIYLYSNAQLRTVLHQFWKEKDKHEF